MIDAIVKNHPWSRVRFEDNNSSVKHTFLINDLTAVESEHVVNIYKWLRAG